MFAILHISSGTFLISKVAHTTFIVQTYEDIYDANKDLETFMSNWNCSSLWTEEQYLARRFPSNITYSIAEFEIIEV